MGKTNPAGLLMDNQVARLVKDSAHQVWLAGLGAYARAEKQGSRLFDNLVTGVATHMQAKELEARLEEMHKGVAQAMEVLKKPESPGAYR